MATLFDDVPAEATLFADGGSRGNPGPAASGAVIVEPGGEVLAEAGLFLGVATNNVAEWTALVIGLEAAAERGIRRLAIRMDSELVVKQVRGEYKVKHESLQPLQRKAMTLLRKLEHFDIKHVPRKLNKLADSLVNSVLDREADLRRLG
jgi:ribonuclease HI